MEKAVVTLLIRSFRGGQATIAHYLYVLYYYIIAVTGGGCFERTEISFISLFSENNVFVRGITERYRADFSQHR